MKRTKRVYLWLDEDEFNELKKKAADCGMMVSTYMRHKLLYKS